MLLLLLLFFDSEKSIISKITAFSSIKSPDYFISLSVLCVKKSGKMTDCKLLK